MLIAQLEANDLEPTSSSHRIHTPTWENIQSAILRLDGERYTEVALMVEPGIGMLISGGFNRTFMCEVKLPNKHWTLVDYSKSDEETVTIVKHEPDTFEEYLTSDLETILTVAFKYCHEGVLNDFFSWEN